MDYYILNEDRRIINPIKRSKNSKDVNDLDVVIKEDIKPTTKIVDYIKKRVLFESSHIFLDEIKNIIEYYLPELCFRGIFVTSIDMKTQFAYWETDISSLKKMKMEKAKNQDDFRLQSIDVENEIMVLILFEQQEFIVMREDLAESIMRRYPLGIKFKQITVC